MVWILHSVALHSEQRTELLLHRKLPTGWLFAIDNVACSHLQASHPKASFLCLRWAIQVYLPPVCSFSWIVSRSPIFWFSWVYLKCGQQRPPKKYRSDAAGSIVPASWLDGWVIQEIRTTTHLNNFVHDTLQLNLGDALTNVGSVGKDLQHQMGELLVTAVDAQQVVEVFEESIFDGIHVTRQMAQQYHGMAVPGVGVLVQETDVVVVPKHLPTPTFQVSRGSKCACKIKPKGTFSSSVMAPLQKRIFWATGLGELVPGILHSSVSCFNMLVMRSVSLSPQLPGISTANVDSPWNAIWCTSSDSSEMFKYDSPATSNKVFFVLKYFARTADDFEQMTSFSYLVRSWNQKRSLLMTAHYCGDRYFYTTNTSRTRFKLSSSNSFPSLKNSMISCRMQFCSFLSNAFSDSGLKSSLRA